MPRPHSRSLGRNSNMNRLASTFIWTWSVVLAVVFVAMGVARLLIPAFSEALTTYTGLPWLPTALGCVEIGCGLLLLWPRTAWQSAAWLAVLSAAQLILALRLQFEIQALLSAALLGSTLVIAYCRHPRTTALARLRAAVDWVAEREIAAQQLRPRS